MEPLRPGDPRSVGAYRLIARLGVGGMGRVFLGRSGRGRMVAVKLVHPELARDDGFRRRFRHEVEAARKVGGEWTAAVLDADTESETPWVATAYVPGPTLQQTVALHGPLPEDSVLALAAGLARALQAVHGGDLIHRDLKPSNVLVTLDGPRVIDFGIARSVDGSVATRTGTVIGSPGFMSPEQVRGGTLTPASDVFCLGAVLAFAATGREPFGGDDASGHALMFRVVSEPADLGDLDGPARALVERCLAKDAADRPSLEEILDSVPVADGPWLPAEVMAELGRRAARLLDLEDPQAEPQPASAPLLPALPSSTPPPVQPPLPPPGPPPGGATRVAPRSRMPLYLTVGAAAAAGVLVTGLVLALTREDGNDGTQGGGGTVAGEQLAGRPDNGGSRDGGSKDGGFKDGGIPADMLGSWVDDSTGPAGDVSSTHLQRITLSQNDGGKGHLTLRSATAGRLCTYTSPLPNSGPPIRLDLEMTLSVPPGCKKKTRVTLRLEAGKLRYERDGHTGKLVRARHDEIPARYQGTWEGAIGRPIAGGPPPPRKRFELTGGPVGSEAVEITMVGGEGPSCSAKAMLVSAEHELVIFSSRLLTAVPQCKLGGMQMLVPMPEGTLQWTDGRGAISILRRV